MATDKTIKIPQAAADIVERRNVEFMQARAALDSSIAVLRAALGVPDAWILRDLREGFIPPPSNGDGTEGFIPPA